MPLLEGMLGGLRGQADSREDHAAAKVCFIVKLTRRIKHDQIHAADLQESIGYYGKAVALSPEFSFAAANRALAMYQVGQTEASIREMRYVPAAPLGSMVFCSIPLLVDAILEMPEPTSDTL